MESCIPSPLPQAPGSGLGWDSGIKKAQGHASKSWWPLCSTVPSVWTCHFNPQHQACQWAASSFSCCAITHPLFPPLKGAPATHPPPVPETLWSLANGSFHSCPITLLTLVLTPPPPTSHLSVNRPNPPLIDSFLKNKKNVVLWYPYLKVWSGSLLPVKWTPVFPAHSLTVCP